MNERSKAVRVDRLMEVWQVNDDGSYVPVSIEQVVSGSVSPEDLATSAPVGLEVSESNELSGEATDGDQDTSGPETVKRKKKNSQEVKSPGYFERKKRSLAKTALALTLVAVGANGCGYYAYEKVASHVSFVPGGDQTGVALFRSYLGDNLSTIGDILKPKE